jgi:membrane protease YdiL (CAAX protease family)
LEQSKAIAGSSYQIATTGLSWWPVLLFLPARLVYSFLIQVLVTALVTLQGSSHPWAEAAAWWPVYSTMADILCLLSLTWLTRREGLTLIDLLGARGKAALRQLVWTPAYLLAIAPFGVLASLITQFFYGPGLPPYIAMVNLPPWAGWYSFLIWPLVWVVAEELGYLGYLFPRLEALSGRTWLAALLVILFWGLQHLANPFIPDATHLISRVLAAWVAVGGVTLVYILGRRRLVPIIGAHYLIDLFTGFLVGILPLLSR